MSGFKPRFLSVTYEVVVDNAKLDEIATILGIPDDERKKWQGLAPERPHELRLIAKGHSEGKE
jgi:hypothetical protein